MSEKKQKGAAAPPDKKTPHHEFLPCPQCRADLPSMKANDGVTRCPQCGWSGPETPRFTIWQAPLAEVIGVPLDQLRDWRDQHLTRRVDWDFDAGHHIVLTEAAAQKLAGLVLSTENDRRLLARAIKPTDAKLKVHRAGPLIPNPRLLEATLDAANAHHAAGAVVCVRVRDNTQFRRGDEITARHHEGIFYDLTSGVPKRKV